MTNTRMDSHKLMYHPIEVARWLKGKEIYPIEIEISPSGACNHRCTFCAVDYLGYKAHYLDKNVILRSISQIREKGGAKSVICSGEGEPLLNKDLPDIVNEMNCKGVDVAMSTNGVLLTKDVARECLAAFKWIRFSVSSFEGKSYNKIQNPSKGDLERVKLNISDAVEIKRQNKHNTTIGVQCLLLPDNMEQLPSMARELKQMGVDYLAVKPFSQHLHSKNKFHIDYESMLQLENELVELSNENFQVIFRAHAMKKMHHKKKYTKCLGLPFMSHIDSKGNVWPCIAHVGSEELSYGNIYEQPFTEIWGGARRKLVNEKLYNMDINRVCRESCRLDEINIYLDELTHPEEHVNFI